MSLNSINLGLTGLNKIPYSNIEMADMLDRTHWLREFAWTDIEQLARFLTVYQASKDSVIFNEGSRDAYLCLLVEGRVEIQKRSSTQENKTLSVLDPGRAFGEMSLIDGEPRSASAVAGEHCLIMVLSKRDFLRLTEENPRMAVKLLLKLGMVLSQRLRQTSGALVDTMH